MLKELLSILRGEDPMKDVSENFQEMLKLVRDMVLEASSAYWGKRRGEQELLELRKNDVLVNKLEREIRKQLITHLSLTENLQDVPYGLLMMSITKDVERLGDYAKNLQEVSQLAPTWPDDPLVAELRGIARDVEDLTRRATDAFESSDSDEAWDLTREGKQVQSRCKEIVSRIATSELATPVSVPLVMGARFYKRIDAHYLNLLSSVIMPLHKLDYFDEEVRE